MFKLNFLIFVTILALSSGHVRREAAPQEADFSLQTVFTIAENGLKKVQEVLLESFDAANTDDLQKKAEAQGETLLTHIQTWIANIKQTTEEWKDNVSVKELREIADNALEGLKSDNPKMTSQITSFVDGLTQTSEKIVEQLKTIVQSDESTQIKELSEKLLGTTKDSFVLIGNELKDAAVGKKP